MKVVSLKGHVSYEAARQLQLRLVELRAEDRIEDTALLLEHRAVITRGRGLQFTGAARPRHMPLPGPLPPGVEFAESERGGDLTYHGPGQLVVYPIFKLDGRGFAPDHDVAGFLRRFEQVFIDLVVEVGADGVRAFSRPNATGVWVRREGEPETAARKIASMGVAVRRWVTYHGIALNCVNGLEPFHLISPCGFSPEVMTRLSDWVASGSETAQRLASWQAQGRPDLERRIARLLGGELVSDILGVDPLGSPEDAQGLAVRML